MCFFIGIGQPAGHLVNLYTLLVRREGKSTGTYLKARCLCGEAITHTGPNGLQAANELTDSLKALGIEMCKQRAFKYVPVHKITAFDS